MPATVTPDPLSPGALIEVTVDLLDYATCPEFMRSEFSHVQLCMWPVGAETFTASTSVATAQIALPPPDTAGAKESATSAPA